MNGYNPSNILFSLFRAEHSFIGFHELWERFNKLQSRYSPPCKCNEQYNAVLAGFTATRRSGTSVQNIVCRQGPQLVYENLPTPPLVENSTRGILGVKIGSITSRLIELIRREGT